MIFLHAMLLVACILLSPLVFVLALEILAALFYKKTTLPNVDSTTRDACKTAILIPAHNEEDVIQGTLKSLVPQLGNEDRILMVADNCSDNTAALARACGAEVIERTNQELRGKGYALEFGVRHLESDPPDVVLIIDADCSTEDKVIERLSRSAQALDRPIQAKYLIRSPANPGLGQRISAFAFLVKNYVRPLGLKVLGLPCQLMGTGMAFPWHVISKAELGNGNIVEDMKLGVDLISAGFPPVFLPEVLVESVFPESSDVAKGQRTRWEHGHIDTIVNYVPRLLAKAVKEFDLKLLLFAFDLAVFPLALLSSFLFLSGLCAALLWLSGSNSALLHFAAFIILTYGFVILLAWFRFGRETISAVQLLSIPVYIFGKLSIYLKFVTNREKKWVKTGRDKEIK